MPTASPRFSTVTWHQAEFPFHEIRDEHGDLFHTIDEAKALGFGEDQIWSLTETDSDDPSVHSIFIYGPPHHIVNRLGFLATFESHDFKTYYEEVFYHADGDFMVDDE